MRDQPYTLTCEILNHAQFNSQYVLTRTKVLFDNYCGTKFTFKIKMGTNSNKQKTKRINEGEMIQNKNLQVLYR